MRNPAPTTAKRQLNAFYARQGLQGRARHRAVRHDMRRVRAYAGPEAFEACQGIGVGLMGMFLFAFTDEGARYWIARNSGVWL